MQRVEGKAQARGGSRSEVLHEHVGALEQPFEHDRRLGVLQVERQALLRAVRPDEMRGQPAHALVVGAREVAHARTLDLDHARAEVGELARAEGRGDRVLEGDDGDAVQRAHQNDLGSPSTCSAT